MKIRTGFVSNSSTTSYTCEICGATEAGSDSCGIEDYGFCMCVNEHTICQEEAIGEPDTFYEMAEEHCPICQFQAISNADVGRLFVRERGITRAEAFEEVKKVNKRRKKLYDTEYVQYVCQKLNLTEEMILKELKEKFGTYSKFVEYLSEEGK